MSGHEQGSAQSPLEKSLFFCINSFVPHCPCLENQGIGPVSFLFPSGLMFMPRWVCKPQSWWSSQPSGKITRTELEHRGANRE